MFPAQLSNTKDSQMRTRTQTLEAIRQNPDITVLIVGAGVNGIGTFRDLALQGIDALIIDKADFCSGASAASSHMIHGGIRYLENGEFRLVREAVQERNRLLQNAPHYAQPLQTTIPIFKWTSGIFNAPLKFINLLDRPSERGAIVIKLGLMMYDAYTGSSNRAVPKHEIKMRKEVLTAVPKINPDILCAATYYDGFMPSPERICMDLLDDAFQASDRVHAINYMRSGKAEGNNVTLHDEQTGETLTVRPKIVINAAGPWIDFTNEELVSSTEFMGGTKGSHLVLNHPELRQAIGESEFFFENEDGRIVLICPFLDRVLVGTSDIPIEDPSQARCTEEEVDYFIEMVERVFPDIEINESHIVFRFSGVRPLPNSNANSAGQISRDHSIKKTPANTNFPIYNLIGGKWTTFRAFSEQTADLILHELNVKRQKSTAKMPIGGGRDYPQTEQAKQTWLTNLQKQTELDLEQLERLFKRYGTRAQEVARFISQEEDQPLTSKPSYSQREIKWLQEAEQVTHLDDLLLRRTLLGMQGHVTSALVEEMAHLLYGANAEAEIERTKQIFLDKHQLAL